jgi:hypothetical protein
MTIKNEISNFVDSVDKTYIAGMVLLGTASNAIQQADSSSDIDIAVFVESKDFFTEPSVYKNVAGATYGRIRPSIKSVRELDENYVAMSRRYIQHLRNVGEVLYQKEGANIRGRIEHLWRDVSNDERIDTAHKTSPSFIIRHRYFELCRGVLTKVMNDKKDQIDAPSKSFWQQASDVFWMDISKEDERNIINIVSKKYLPDKEAYEQQGYYSDIRDRVNALNKRLGEEGMNDEIIYGIEEAYMHGKNLVELNMWKLSEHLKNNK